MKCNYNNKKIIVEGKYDELFELKDEGIWVLTERVKKRIQGKADELYKKCHKAFPSTSLYLAGFTYNIISEAQVNHEQYQQMCDFVQGAHLKAFGKKEPYKMPVNVEIVKAATK